MLQVVTPSKTKHRFRTWYHQFPLQSPKWAIPAIAGFALVLLLLFLFNPFSSDAKLYPLRPAVQENTRPLKIFVYKMPSMYNYGVLARKPWCEEEIFGTEQFLHKAFTTESSVVTKDPEEADYFYVPTYPTCLVYKNFGNFRAYIRFVEKSIHYVMRLPYFNRSGGVDHIWPFVHDFGPCMVWNEESANGVYFDQIRNSIFITHMGDLGISCFDTYKDIVIPPLCSDPAIYLNGHGGADVNPDDRKIFIHFRGTIVWKHAHDLPALGIKQGPDPNYSRGIRQAMYDLYKDDPLFSFNDGNSDNYVAEVKNSTFCLCPRGYAGWSRRLFDSIMLGCIPVVIADDIELPFEPLIDYRKVSVKVLEKDIGRLKEILTGISRKRIAYMQENIKLIWKAFSYSLPSTTGDAFEHIVQMLQLRSRTHRPVGPDTFGY